MILKQRIKIIRDFYGYETSYYRNMLDACEKAEIQDNYSVSKNVVSKQSPFLTWEIEHLIGEYYFNTQKPFDFNLLDG